MRQKGATVQNAEIHVSIKALPEFMISGISTQTTNQAEMGVHMAKIPMLWQTFFADGIQTKIPHKNMESVVLAAYTNYENNHHGKYSLIIGAPVSKKVENNPSMTTIIIPEAKYLVFSNQGPDIPQVVMQAWQYIWNYFEKNTPYKRAYLADFEWYDTMTPNKVEIYISIEIG